jgi:hypothetical protein
MRGHPTKTPERVELARQLRVDGLVWREIGKRLGVCPSTVQAWVMDPDGTQGRARKDSYAQPCIDCGGPTSGSEGRREKPRCHLCAMQVEGGKRKVWTKEAVVLAIQEWDARYNDPPAVADWNSWVARAMNDEARAIRYERDHATGACPSFMAVVEAFGSWNAAICAAGFDPRPARGGNGNELRRRSMRAKAEAQG